MQQAHVQMALTIVPRTKAAHVLPCAICKATPGPLLSGLSPHGAIIHLLSFIISH